MVTLHVIADSISMHYGPYLHNYIRSWCKYSRKDVKIGNADNPEGPNGQDSPKVLAYVRRCIEQRQHWSTALLNCGLWDIRNFNGVNQTDITAYETNLEAIYELLPAVADQVVWVRTTPVNDELHNSLKRDFKRFDHDVVRYNQVADMVAARHGAYIVDLYSFCRSIGLDDIYLDHIHFTEDMRKLQAAFVAGQLIAHLHLEASTIYR